jgi:hypothetical protein
VTLSEFDAGIALSAGGHALSRVFADEVAQSRQLARAPRGRHAGTRQESNPDRGIANT